MTTKYLIGIIFIYSMFFTMFMSGCECGKGKKYNEYVKCEPPYYNGTATKAKANRNGTWFTDSQGNRRDYPPSVKCEIIKGKSKPETDYEG